MSTTVTNLAAGQGTLAIVRPRFFGIVGGELFKVTRMCSIWISFVLLLGVICLPYLVTATVKAQKTSLQKAPLHFFYNSVSQNLFVLRVFIGFFLIILTACVFGREYQLGTIRVLLARGIGRLQPRPLWKLRSVSLCHRRRHAHAHRRAGLYGHLRPRNGDARSVRAKRFPMAVYSAAGAHSASAEPLSETVRAPAG